MNTNVVDDLLKNIKLYQDNLEIGIIEKAIEFAKKAHNKQFRESGDPYYLHPIEVAKILADLKLDNASIACGLLHDTVEDTTATLDEIKDNFGLEIANLVEGLTKINKFSLKV
ncbi:MAG: GTP pyrophosphokinase rsh, partial [Alphaproteobacteria bacterium MarineAlpha5_Bin8]